MSYGYSYGLFETSLISLIRRERERRERARQRRERAQFHFAASEASLLISSGLESRVVSAKLLLHEVQPGLCALFGGESLAVGAEVSLTIEHPRQFYMKAEVAACRTFSLASRVLSSAQSFPYRIWLVPKFETDEERADALAYMKWIHENCLWMD